MNNIFKLLKDFNLFIIKILFIRINFNYLNLQKNYIISKNNFMGSIYKKRN